MRKHSSATLASAFLIVAAACSEKLPVETELTAPPAAALLAVQPQSNAGGTLTERAAFDNRICELRFPGTPSQTSEFFVIWNLGHGILDVPFDTDRPDLYAVLPGTMHTDPAHPELDHDHIVSAAPGTVGYDGTWDVWAVVPGSAFNPATYVAPRSVDAMFALIHSNVLAGPFSFSQAGFGRDLVLRAPLLCTGK
jgi:hypothetical protein